MIGDGANTYQWDAESHLTAVYASATGAVVSLNTYNALGQRVEDVTQTGTTEEAYGADGALLERFTGDSNGRSFVPFAGGLLAEYYCGGVIFDHPDEIGSLTTATGRTGNTVNETLYYPYGEHWTGALMPNLGAHPMFAKLPDYDAETDQFNTLNRHYSPSGRWMSPDPGGVKIVNLQDPQGGEVGQEKESTYGKQEVLVLCPWICMRHDLARFTFGASITTLRARNATVLCRFPSVRLLPYWGRLDDPGSDP